MHKAPGKAFRTGLSFIELMDIFPTEDAATEWVESIDWLMRLFRICSMPFNMRR